MARTLEQKSLERMCFTQWKAKNMCKRGGWRVPHKNQDKSINKPRRKNLINSN